MVNFDAIGLSPEVIALLEQAVAHVGDVEVVKRLASYALLDAGWDCGQLWDFVQDFDYPIVEGSEYFDQLGVFMSRYVDYLSELPPGIFTIEDFQLASNLSDAFWEAVDYPQDEYYYYAVLDLGFKDDRLLELLGLPEFT